MTMDQLLVGAVSLRFGAQRRIPVLPHRIILIEVQLIILFH